MGAADTHSTLQTELFEALCDCRGRGRKENAEKEEIEAKTNERRRPGQDATPLQQEGKWGRDSSQAQKDKEASSGIQTSFLLSSQRKRHPERPGQHCKGTLVVEVKKKIKAKQGIITQVQNTRHYVLQHYLLCECSHCSLFM